MPHTIIVPALPPGRLRSRAVPMSAAVVSVVVFRRMLAGMPFGASRLFASAFLLFLPLAFFLAPPLLFLLRICSLVGLGRDSNSVCAGTWPAGGTRLLPRGKTPGYTVLVYKNDEDKDARTYSAAARASASCSLILLISSSRSASVCLISRLYQWMSLFFCQRPVGALILWPR